MKLAEIVDIEPSYSPRHENWCSVEIPSAFRRPLGLRQGSMVSVYEERLSSSPTTTQVPEEQQSLIITTIPGHCWKRLVRFTCLLGNAHGALARICRVITDVGGNILIMEGFAHDNAGEAWWSSLIHFPEARQSVGAGAPRVPTLSEKRVELVSRMLDLYREESTEAPWPFSPIFIIDGNPCEYEQHAREKDRIERATQTPATDLPSSRAVPFAVSATRLAEFDPSITESADDRTEYDQRGYLRIRNDELRKIWKSDELPAKGLLTCDTDEGFLRLTPKREFATIQLSVETTGDDKVVGRGVLAAIAETLENRDVNLCYTYNFLEDRTTGKGGVGHHKERSRIDLFCERNGRSTEVHDWQSIFSDLFATKRTVKGSRGDDVKEPFIVREEALLKIPVGRGRVRTFHGSKHDELVHEKPKDRSVRGVWERFRRYTARRLVRLWLILIAITIVTYIFREDLAAGTLVFGAACSLLGGLGGRIIDVYLGPSESA